MAAAKPIRFIGNYDYSAEGKFLFEILCQLRKMGAGRIVTKTEWTRKWPTEPSYIKIIKAFPEMDPWQQKGRVYGEWVFRGRNLGVYEFSKDLNRSDWKLVPKSEEKKLLYNRNQMENIIFPRTFPLPPLQILLAKKFAKVAGMRYDEKNSRAPLKLCIDPQFKMIEKLFEQFDVTLCDNAYDENDKDSILSLYGDMLPTKVEAWNIGEAKFEPRFKPDPTLV
uniref:39S ribosomal protein L28, mitochondrial n=1 Tax=Strongyloides venezuelensis TaxID=75913 RepID=A0A0K0F3I7_STRVS